MLFESIGLFCKTDELSECLTNRLLSFLEKEGFSVFLFDQLDKAQIKRLNLMIIIGGDGTFLRGVSQIVTLNVPVLGINTGHLGYLSALEIGDSLEKELQALLSGFYQVEKRILLEVCIGQRCFFALNEFVIHRKHSGHMIEFDVSIDKRYVFTQRSNGLIVSTPTGSTAYSLSAGGPIVQPDLSLMLLVSICPHALTQRPLVVSSDKLIELDIVDFKNAEVNIDGRQDIDLCEDKVLIQKADYELSVLHTPSHDHYHRMRQKLKWSAS